MLAEFFDRIFGAVGKHLSVSRDALSAALAEKCIGIACAPALTRNDIWISELTANLVARLYPRVALSGTSHDRDRIEGILRGINPRIAVVKEAPDELTIALGAHQGSDFVLPSASGWVAALGNRVAGEGPANPYAASMAAALGVGELFCRAFDRGWPAASFSLSLLNYDQSTGAEIELSGLEAGKMLFAGAGAVGNAAIWVLARDTEMRGSYDFVDHETLTLPNLQRYVLGTFRDVGTRKVDLATREFKERQLSTSPFFETLEAHADKTGGLQTPTILVSVDNVETRRATQALLPRLVINGWTGENSAGASWHVFNHDAACLSCLYLPRGQAPSAIDQAAAALGIPIERARILWIARQPLTDDDVTLISNALSVDKKRLMPWRGRTLGELYTEVVCGGVALDLAGVGRLETVPLAHQSVLAGVMAAAELRKRLDPSLATLVQPEVLVSVDDVLRPPPAIWRKPRARETGCICGDPYYRSAYQEKWGPFALNTLPSVSTLA